MIFFGIGNPPIINMPSKTGGREPRRMHTISLPEVESQHREDPIPRSKNHTSLVESCQPVRRRQTLIV